MPVFFEKIRTTTQLFNICDASIVIEGCDAETYLHGQTTNNVHDLMINSFQFNSLLDRSGKIISAFIICRLTKDKFKILIQKEYLDQTISRIDQYHISEDFSVTSFEENSILKTNTSSGDVCGRYFFENDSISFEIKGMKYNLSSKHEFNYLKLLTGVPELGKEVLVGEIFNNTFYTELAINYNKGCFPGQETVSKINSGRGAAYAPMLLIIRNVSQDLTDDLILLGDTKINSRKVGIIKSYSSVGDTGYLYVSMLREFRINNFEITLEIPSGKIISGKLYSYPYLSPFKEELAVELYDRAMDLFLGGDNVLAIEYFGKAIKVNPLFEDAYESLGVLFGRIGDYDKAILLMGQLQEINSKCLMALTNLSLYHMKLGHIEIAEKFKSDATILNFELLGVAASAKRDHEEIEKNKISEQSRREDMFKQVLEMDEQDAMANCGLGEIYIENKNYSGAIQLFEMAIKEDQKYSIAYLGLAQALIFNKLNTKAIKVLNDGIKVAGKNGDLMPANKMHTLLLNLTNT